jgi:hypothetical protein
VRSFGPEEKVGVGRDPPEGTRAEHRAHARFPLILPVRYTVSRRHEIGWGWTIDLSKSGLRFTADRPLEPGLRLALAIDWPVLLEGVVPLQLCESGVVVWTRGTETALQIKHRVFKTRRAQPAAASRQESFAEAVLRRAARARSGTG